MEWGGRLLMTVPGIGYYSALLIVSEVGDINRFPDSYHLCSYAGLITSTHSSGGITYGYPHPHTFLLGFIFVMRYIEMMLYFCRNNN